MTRINTKMPTKCLRTIPCSSCARLFSDKRAVDAHFNDVHRARPVPQAVPKARGNFPPAQSHPSGQKNQKPLQGIHLARESNRTRVTDNRDNADYLFVPFAGSIGHPLTNTSPTQAHIDATSRWENSIQFVQESGKGIDTSSPARKPHARPNSNRGPGSQPKQKRNQSQFKPNPNTAQWMDMHEDLDWGLCDKECGWCGHCMDGVDF